MGGSNCIMSSAPTYEDLPISFLSDDRFIYSNIPFYMSKKCDSGRYPSTKLMICISPFS
ncbi:hypothetical protein SK128_024743 [Halocaridina rubra]|uniref:Uncharacterized protein n=1 Tax=Halocaridina rubra TaxID=373956 RepID=A0AAN8X597_HALRR